MGLFSEEALQTIQQEERQIRKHTILIVDDEAYNLKILKDVLDDYYHVLTATDGQDALELLQRDEDPSRIHLIISDQRMPRMTGVQFLQQSVEIIPQAIRIILTGYTDVEAIMDSINQARIYKFILKPFDKQDILLTVQRALDTYELEAKNIQLLEALKFLNGSLFNHMRGLIQGISGGAELLRLEGIESFSERQQDLLSHMESSTDDMIRLLERASGLSFVYTGSRPAQKEQLDIVGMLKGVGDSFAKTKSPDELSIQYQWRLEGCKSGQESLFLEVDRELLTIAIMEILENCFSYSEKPSKIMITAATQHEHFTIQIRDRGIGLHNEGGEALVRPFLRGEKSHEFQPFGFGIGLAKAKAFVEAQGGDFSLQKHKQGTTVTVAFSLPVMEEEMFPTIDENEKNILLFLESPEETQLYQDVLEFEGHHVTVPTKPDGLIDWIKREAPDLVFLSSKYHEILMESTVREIRKFFSRDLVPIVIVANDPDQNEKQSFLDSGANEYISKPMEYDQLIMLVEHLK